MNLFFVTLNCLLSFRSVWISSEQTWSRSAAMSCSVHWSRLITNQNLYFTDRSVAIWGFEIYLLGAYLSQSKSGVVCEQRKMSSLPPPPFLFHLRAELFLREDELKKASMSESRKRERSAVIINLTHKTWVFLPPNGHAWFKKVFSLRS